MLDPPALELRELEPSGMRTGSGTGPSERVASALNLRVISLPPSGQNSKALHLCVNLTQARLIRGERVLVEEMSP